MPTALTTTDTVNQLTNKVIGLAIEIHRTLGPGFTEKMYASAMAIELKTAGIPFRREQVVSVHYKGTSLGNHRIDFLVDDQLVIEFKAVSQLTHFHMAQLLSYLKVADKRLGLILNFARSTVQIKRVANRF